MEDQAYDERPIKMRPSLAWGFLTGFCMLAAALSFTLLLGAMLQSRAETKHELAMAGSRSLAMAPDKPFTAGLPKQVLAPVAFTQEFVAGRGEPRVPSR